MAPEDFVALDAYFAEMDVAVAEGDIAGFARANRSFHFVVFDRSGRDWMVRFLNIIWDAAARYQTSLFLTPGWQRSLQRHHAELKSALRDGDVGEVNRIMNEHRQVTIEASHAASETGYQAGSGA
jgi:DNA-binding GntR family transcriptional regulator